MNATTTTTTTQAPALSTTRAMFDQDAAAGAMKTARAAGAVGSRPVVLASILDRTTFVGIFPGTYTRILDFGCGRGQMVCRMRDEFEGCTVEGYDFALPGSEQHLDTLWDVVTVSNVLNVQDSTAMLDLTCKQLRALALRGAVIVANYPQSPRKMGLTAKAMRAALERRGFKVILEDKRGGTPVWYLEACALPEVTLEIQRDLSWDEFRVAVYLDGVFQEGPTRYCGPDLQDARVDMECMQAAYQKAGSKYDFKGIKYGYRLSQVEPCEPQVITSRGIVARRITPNL